MPFHRIVRYAGPLVAWHDIAPVPDGSGWSDAYRAESPRMLIPRTRCIEAEQQGQRFVCDALTPLALTPETPYRVRRPHAGQRSVVLVFGSGDDGALRRTPRLRLGPAAQWRLAACRAAIAQGVPDRLGLEESLLALLPAGNDGDGGDGSACASPADAAGCGADASRAARRAVEGARELLASDPASPASLHEIARSLAVSPFHLARSFKRATGVGLHGYRTRLRMALALDRLGDGEPDLTALALDLGYSAHSHFTAAFRSHFGAPPSLARRLLSGRAGIR